MSNIRTTWLLAFTGLVVGYVRLNVQYHRHRFDSFLEFAGFWFVHYIAVALVGALFYASLRPMMRRFHGALTNDKAPSIDDVLIMWCLAVLLCAVAVFATAHWPAGDIESLDE